MKKSSFLLGAAALMLATSCSNDEVVNVAPQSGAIGFSSFVDNATRAADNTKDNLTTMKVYGVASSTDVAAFIEFNGVDVTKTSGTWGYSPLKYWLPGFSYSFAAVAPINANISVENGKDQVRGGITAINLTNDGTVDVLYGAQEEAVENTTVEFTLGHILSRVKFAFENGMREGYSIKVSNVSIENAETKGSYNPATPEWTYATDNATKGFSFPMAEGKDYVAANKLAESEPLYLIPRAVSEAGYIAKFTVTLYDEAGEAEDIQMVENTFEVTIPAMEYKLGYSYTLKTVLNDENIDPDNKLKPIEFDVEEVKGWDQEVESEFTTSKEDKK